MSSRGRSRGLSVAVVGGGVIGLAIAWRAAVRGFSVTVFDPDPGRGASWAAGGMLAPTAEAYHGEEGVLRLGLASSALYPAFVAELEADAGAPVGYSERGTLLVARDADDAGEIRRLLELQHALGLVAEWQTSRELRRLEPALAPTVRGGVWMPNDHQIDNRLLLAALRSAGEARGVRFERRSVGHATATAVTLEGGEVRDADRVVVATGAALPRITVAGAPAEFPVRPVKGQIVRVRATGAAVFPARTVRGLGVYIVPRPHGEIAVGATAEEKGFDTSVTAGAVMQLLRDAWELVPGLAEAELVDAVAGLRPGSPDNLPLVGPAGPGGPILALGHYRHGILLAPVTAELVLAYLTGEARMPLDGVAAVCDPARFAPAEASA